MQVWDAELEMQVPEVQVCRMRVLMGRLGSVGLGCGPGGHPAVTRRGPTTDVEGSAPPAPPTSTRGSSLGSVGHTADPGPALAAVPPRYHRPRRGLCARPGPCAARRPWIEAARRPRVPPSPRPSPSLTISALPAAWPRPCRLHAAGRAGGHRALTSGPRASVARQRRPGGDVTAGTPAPSPEPSRPRRAPSGAGLWRRAAVPCSPTSGPRGLRSVSPDVLSTVSPMELTATCRVHTQWLHVGSLPSSLGALSTQSAWSPMVSCWVRTVPLWPHIGFLWSSLSVLHT